MIGLCIFSCLSIGCHVNNIPVQNKENIFSLKKYGAKGDGIADDSPAFRAAMQALIASKTSDAFLFVEKGTYLISEVGFRGTIHSPLKIVGEDGAKFICKKTLLDISGKTESGFTVIGQYKRGNQKIKLNKTPTITTGIVRIISEEVGELSWNTKKSDTHLFTSKGKDLSLESSLNFNYNKVKQILIFNPERVEISNLTLELSPTVNFGMQFSGLMVSLKDITSVCKKKKGTGSHIVLNTCINTSFENSYIEGKHYGFNIVHCRNIKALNTKAYHLFHPFTPGKWTDTFFASNIRGRYTSIDSHPAFNIHYDDVDLFTGDGYFNCRALGIKLTNCRFRANPSNKSKSLLIAYLSLTPACQYLFDEYDVLLENVDWQHTLYDFNGLHVFGAKKLTIKNCISHSISTGQKVKEILITDSKMGFYKCYHNTFTIKNSTFDGHLQQLDYPKYAISCSFTGKAIIDNCNFINYNANKSYLLKYLHNFKRSEIEFKNCEISNFKSLVESYGNPAKDYQGLNFVDCDIKDITSPYATQLKSQWSKLDKAKKSN